MNDKGMSRPLKMIAGMSLLVFFGWEQTASATVAQTKHNLSASRSSAGQASGETEDVCVFCHTPHNASPSRALWNQALPGTTYTLYSSPTLKATLNQPTGSSRLCLSCHDGTLAMGSLRAAPKTGVSRLNPLTGSASLGTDLSDDHPISFVYDAALALKHGELADPSVPPDVFHLDASRQVQCTSCHDPHDATYRKFLRTDDRFAALCLACHRLKNWAGSAHATSRASWSGTGTAPWPSFSYATVAENGCENCHRPHAAPHPAELLAQVQEQAVCMVCHNGNVASKNLEPEFLKVSAHPVAATDGVHTPREDPATMSRHVTCTDCHNPHQAVAASGRSAAMSWSLRGVQGVDLSGAVVTEARFEYEVCLKCHGITDQVTPGLVRQDNTRNVRVEINPSNPSYHPLAAAGKHPALQGLEPGYEATSLVACTDCHNNDEWTDSGMRPRGPHGSRFEPILERDYQQGDPAVESFQSYALCYKCHSRNVLLNSGPFPHRTHVQTGQASCAVCHDAHGSREHVRLINFMLRDRTGLAVVTPNRTGLLQYRSTGLGHGECSLTCHGQDHDHRSY